MKSFNSVLGSIFRRARLKKKVNQKDVASVTGIKSGRIFYLEHGRSCLKIDEFVVLCKFYDLDIKDVFSKIIPLVEPPPS